MPASRWRPSRHATAGLLLFVSVFALYVAIQRVSLASYDGKVMYGLTRRLVDAHTLTLTQTEDVYGRHTPYSAYGIGVSLALVPLYVVQKALGLHRDLLVTLVNPALLALTALLLYRIGRVLGLGPRGALYAPLLFGYLTLAVPYSTELFSEPGVALSIAMVLLGLLTAAGGRTGPALITGGGIGLGLLFRTDSLVLVAAPAILLAPLFVPIRRVLADPLALATFALPVAGALSWLAAYSQLRDGTPIPRTYGGTWSVPFGEGLSGLLLHGGKGFFFYNPVLLLALPGLPLLARRHRGVALLALVLAAARPLFYARWSAWGGGVAWGPRFLMPACVPMALAAGTLLADLPPLWRGRLRARLAAVLVAGGAGLLVTASAIVTYASVAVGYEQFFNRTMYVDPRLPATQRAALLHQQGHDYYHSFWRGQIPGNLRLVAERKPTALFWFRFGPSSIGLATLAVATVGPFAAMLLASPPRQRPSPTPPTRASLR